MRDSLLAGVNVSVGAIPAPLTFVSATQINFEVPFEVPAGDTADVIVTVGGVASAPLTVQMASCTKAAADIHLCSA